jgi:ubiquinone/menaquinone biosynthesis C-methylase UbiE
MKGSVQDDSGLKRVLTISKLYDLFQNLIGGEKARKWVAKEIWKLRGGEKVVDMGCGPGSSLDYLPENIDYWGIDLSETYIETARKQYPTRGNFLVGTAADFINSSDTRLDKTDLILCNGLLHHLCDEEAVEVLELSKRILKPGGRLVCLEATFLVHQTWLSKWIISKDRGRYIRSEREWKKLIGKVFNSYSTDVVTGLIRIPYTHLIIECFREPSLRDE